jgi:hypothetical protein
MKRTKLVLAVVAVMVASIMFAAPAMADVEDRLDERADRIEERLENHGFDVDVDEEDVLFWYGAFDYELDYEDGDLVLEID